MIHKKNKYYKSISAFSLIELSIVILIIGLLVAGVTKGGQLYNKINLVSARSVTKGSAANYMKGLFLWYDATSTEGFNNEYSDNDAVDHWNNINPQQKQQYNLSQPDNQYKPTYLKDGINGLPALYFNGDALYESVPLDASYSIFVVFYRDENGPSQDGILSFNGGIHIEINQANEHLRMLHRSGDSGGNNNFSNSPVAINKNYIMTYVRDFENQDLGLWFNDVDYAPASPAVTLGDFNQDFRDLTIGAGYVNGARPLVGKIGEVIIFDNALKQKEIDAIESYLSQKWSIDLE